MFMWFGIERPDNLPAEVKAAADKIKVGVIAAPSYNHYVFLCSECDRSGGSPVWIYHRLWCTVGKVFEEWEKTLPKWMRTTKRSQ